MRRSRTVCRPPPLVSGCEVPAEGWAWKEATDHSGRQDAKDAATVSSAKDASCDNIEIKGLSRTDGYISFLPGYQG